MECELLNKCGFFRKYMESREAACQGLDQHVLPGEKNE